MAEIPGIAGIVAASAQLASDISKAAGPPQVSGSPSGLWAQLDLLRHVLEKVESQHPAAGSEPVESFEVVVIGNAQAEHQARTENPDVDVVTENQVFEVVISGIRVELEALSALIANTGPEEATTTASDSTDEAHVKLHLDQIESLREVLELIIADASEFKLSDFLESLRVSEDLERFGVTAEVIKNGLNSFLLVEPNQSADTPVTTAAAGGGGGGSAIPEPAPLAAQDLRSVQAEEEHKPSPTTAASLARTPTRRREVDLDWVHVEEERGTLLQPQIFHRNNGLRDLLVRDAVNKTGSKLIGPLLRLNTAKLGDALIKPFSRLLDVMLNAAMAIPAPLLLLMAYISMGNENWRGALRYLRSALLMVRRQTGRGPRSYETLILHATGTCHYWLNERELAIKHYTEVIDLGLATPNAMYGGPIVVNGATACLRMLRHLYRFGEAEEFYHRYYDRCMAHMSQHHPEAPRMPLENTFKKHAALWMATNLYPVLVGLGRLEEAVDGMRALLLDNDVKGDDWEYCRIQVNLADVLCRLSSPTSKAEASELLSSARSRLSRSKKIKTRRKESVLRDIAMLTYLALGDAATAEADLIQCAQLEEQDPECKTGRPCLKRAEIYFWLGECQEFLGRPAEAAETFRMVARVHGAAAAGGEEGSACSLSPRWGTFLEARAHKLARDLPAEDIYNLLLVPLQGDLTDGQHSDHWPEKLAAYSFLLSGDIARDLGEFDHARRGFEAALEWVERHVQHYRGTFTKRLVWRGLALRGELEKRLAALPPGVGMELDSPSDDTGACGTLLGPESLSEG